MTDEQIIGQLRTENPDKALVRLYRHLPKVERMVRNAGGTRADAKDLFQEALIILLGRAKEHSFRLTCSISTYLYAICRNKWQEELRRNWDAVVSLDIQGESLPYEDHRLDLDPTYQDVFGAPLLRLTYDFRPNDAALYRYLAQRCVEIMDAMGPDRSAVTEELDPYSVSDYQSTHNTGGAIMGADPSDSVTNSYGQVWDTPNLYVTGAALYPQNPGHNPTATLCALAYRTADTPPLAGSGFVVPAAAGEDAERVRRRAIEDDRVP